MYLINITIKDEAINDQKLLAKHRNWFNKHFTLGNFLLVGPYLNKENSGLIIAKPSTYNEITEILKENAYYNNNLAKYEINEFTANLIADTLPNYKRR